MSDLDRLVSEAKVAFDNSNSINELDVAKSTFLGKSGSLSKLFKSFANISSEEKKELGKSVNHAKNKIEEMLSNRKIFLISEQTNRRLSEEAVDVTLPGRGLKFGSIHPVTKVIRRIEQIFTSIGFDVVDGPEIENDWFNFSALNNPENHPARSMQDTFYLDRKDDNNLPLLLRTHTSPVQVRYATCNRPPIKIIAPGRTYRVDSDSTHSPMFHQVEGLWIGKNINFADLKGLYISFLKVFFENNDLQIRFRPSFFPFTEPSAEIDLSFPDGPLKGKWLEVSGAGQVHPSVIKNFGFDPEEYMGFAFGSGIERLAMLRYGISDLRLFFENDLRFLNQFSGK
ncbi:MAG: phenylalanine--tRNA ligase subunit alpha [Betaproteobacteria bacterium TMED156]|nr:MAG: phenylalanine--tRNA ligase subunit alpha [Betaproteobacteria bacterium TMED156]